MLRQVRDAGRAHLLPTDLQQLEARLRADLALYAPDSPVITCKTPLDFRWAGLVLAAMPDARVVHLLRDHMETCWSNYRTCFTSNGNGFAYDLADLAHFHDLHLDLMQTYKQAFPDRIRTLAYADLVSDFADQARSLVAYCGLDWSEACLHPDRAKTPVLTASAMQVRKPVYNGNRQDWKRYEAYLSPLIEALQEGAESATIHP